MEQPTNLEKSVSPVIRASERMENEKSRAKALLVSLNTRFPGEFTNDFESFSMAALAKYEDMYGEITESEDTSFKELKAIVLLNIQKDIFYDYVRRREGFIGADKK